MSVKVLNEKVTPVGYIDQKAALALSKRRKKANLSEKEASERIGCSTRTLRRLESSWDVSLRFSSILKMFDLYNIKIYLEDDDDKKYNTENNNNLDATNEKILKIIGIIPNLKDKQIKMVTDAVHMLTEEKRQKAHVDSKARLELINQIQSLSPDKVDMLCSFILILSKI